MAFKLNDGTYIMGTPGANGEELDDPLCDRFPLIVATSKHRLFQSIITDVRDGVALTAADTNNNAPKGQLPNNEKWWLHKLQIFFQAIDINDDTEMQDIFNMFRNLTFRANINGKSDAFNFPVWAMLGSSQFLHQPAATLNSKSGMQNIFLGEWELKTPIVLEAGANWYMEVEHVVAPAATIAGDFVAFRWQRRRVFGV
jgi:hypothetical protein